MKNFIEGIIDCDKSIIKDYIINYKYPWEFLDDLNETIIKIGKKLNKQKFSEVYKNVWINNKAIVDSTAKIIGPCIIDKGTIIKVNAYIRENVFIGEICVVGNSSEVKNSVLFNEVKIPHFNYIGDSILGYKAHLGAGAITSNVKSDGSFVKTIINGSVYNTKRKKYGAIIGDNVEIGCNAVVAPGTFIKSNSIVYPLVMVRGEIEKNKIVKDMNKIVSRNLIKLYIDFDSTLFNTEKFYMDFLNICEKNGIKKQNIELHKKEMLNNRDVFDLEEFMLVLLEKNIISNSIVNQVNNLYLNDYVYEDVVPVLEDLTGKYELILLTYGNHNYQMHKIQSSGLKKYFNKIIVTNNKKNELENVDYENGIFIDNNPIEVEKFYKRNVKKVIRIRRENDKKSKIDTDVNIPEYADLCELYNKELK